MTEDSGAAPGRLAPGDRVHDGQLPSGPIVVGVDGSESSVRAIGLAAREAVLHGKPLRLVHAFVWPYLPSVPMAAPPVAPAADELRAAAEKIIADGVAYAGRIRPGLEVSGELLVGTAPAVLIEESRNAGMIVLGDRGLGGFTGMLVGSVAIQVVSHAAGPVLVSRGRPDPDGPVVLGVDGSPESAAAVGFAFEEAAFRHADLVALHAWRHPVTSEWGETLPLVYDVDDVQAEERRLLAEAMAGWRERYPEVSVHQRLVRGRNVPALLEAAESAQLLVVGARGRGGFAGMLLGSVSQGVLHHAACPVAVIRRRHAG